MNERIRELVLQANPASKEIYESDNWEYNCAAWCAQDVEKFAELIIRECAKISIGDDPSFLEASALEDGARRMLKHFGVEE